MKIESRTMTIRSRFSMFERNRRVFDIIFQSQNTRSHNNNPIQTFARSRDNLKIRYQVSDILAIPIIRIGISRKIKNKKHFNVWNESLYSIFGCCWKTFNELVPKNIKLMVTLHLIVVNTLTPPQHTTIPYALLWWCFWFNVRWNAMKNVRKVLSRWKQYEIVEYCTYQIPYIGWDSTRFIHSSIRKKFVLFTRCSYGFRANKYFIVWVYIYFVHVNILVFIL